MAGIRIEVDTSAVNNALEALGPGVANRAIARAINRTLTSVRRLILRELSDQIGLTQRRLARQVRTQRVSQRGASRVGSGRQGVLGRSVTLRGSITAAGSDITATAFGARQTRRGVSFSPGRKARRQTVAGAFLANVPGGFRGAFIRATDAPNVLVGNAEDVRRRRRVVPRGSDIPIAKLVLPGVSRALFDDEVQRTIQQEGEETLAKRLTESVELELINAVGRARRRAGRR